MEHIDFGYSLKNIPIPSKNTYIYKLIDKTEKVIKRMRWKAFFFEKDEKEREKGNNNNDNDNTEQEECQPVFKTRKCPPQQADMKEFESDLLKMIENIEFRKTSNEFSNTLKADIRYIKNSEKVFVPADKTQNFYEMSKDDYNKILTENITKSYKKASHDVPSKITKEAKKLAKAYKLADRVDIMAQRESFFTIKDHKENFRTHPKYRLLNPTKSELGKLSKQILQKVNNKIKAQKPLNQWTCSKDTINWFKKIPNKQSYTFTIFDIEEFYPSITEDLLRKSIDFAKTITDIEEHELCVIFHCRKSLLYNGNEPWVKKQGNQDFDVTMGSYDGAEVCELVGLYMLDLLSKNLGTENIGLYRDDGLAIFKTNSGPQNERNKKEIIKTFKNHNLKLDIKSNLKVVDYLDVTFDLRNGSFKPYRKPNNDSRYVNASSNHPPTIIKHIPKSISQRLSTISSDKQTFKAAAPHYNNMLKNSGFQQKVEYIPNPPEPTQRKKRKRNVIWYNPPYSQNVKTNVGKRFLSLINKHFGNGHKYHKIFNKNNVKVSYSCMDNMKKIIDSHNKKVLKSNCQNNRREKSCNCRSKPSCPLSQNCLVKGTVYKATVTTDDANDERIYIGLTENTFKQRFARHKTTFTLRKYENETELSKYIWRLHDRGKHWKIDWSILKKATPYSPISKTCNLCLTEKLLIATMKEKDKRLNKRSEFISKCRHEYKYILENN